MTNQNNEQIISPSVLSKTINGMYDNIISYENKSIKSTFFKWLKIGEKYIILKQLLDIQHIFWEKWCVEHFLGMRMSRIQESMKMFNFAKQNQKEEVEYLAELGFDNSLEVMRALDKVTDINRRKTIMELNEKKSCSFMIDDRYKKVEMAKWLINLSKIAVAIDPSTINIEIIHSAIIANGSISDHSVQKIVELASKPDELNLYCKQLIINGGDDNSKEEGSKKYSLNVTNAIFHDSINDHKEQSIPITDYSIKELYKTYSSFTDLLAITQQNEADNAA